MEVKLRALELNDIPSVQEVAHATYDATYTSWTDAERAAVLGELYATERLEGAYRNPSVRAWVAETDRRVVGYAYLVVGQLFASAGEGVLMAFYVLPDYQGRGLGSRLFDTVCEAARDADCAALWVAVLKDNLRSRRWYEAHGFVYDRDSVWSPGGVEQTDAVYRLTL